MEKNKKVTIQAAEDAALNCIRFFLNDWKSNIKNFDIVTEDIQQRFKMSFPKYLKK